MNAMISPCGQYRYLLERGVASTLKAPLLVCMLNPSTADATQNDPTIRRCLGFAQREGRNLQVINLYALRSTNPAKLWSHLDPVGPENDDYLRWATRAGREVVCAWGGNARQDRVDQVVAIFRSNKANLKCFGVTQHGAPKHPLYLPAAAPLIEWRP
jgi:hypothetical protein